MIAVEGSRLRCLAFGTATTDAADTLAVRLAVLHVQLSEVIAAWQPDMAAVEETFVNKDPVATLKLGQARAVSLLVPAQAGLPVAEYPPNQVKKSVVGVGHAAKAQVQLMVCRLLNIRDTDFSKGAAADAADALAVAICHAHFVPQRGREKLAG